MSFRYTASDSYIFSYIFLYVCIYIGMYSFFRIFSIIDDYTRFIINFNVHSSVNVGFKSQNPLKQKSGPNLTMFEFIVVSH